MDFGATTLLLMPAFFDLKLHLNHILVDLSLFFEFLKTFKQLQNGLENIAWEFIKAEIDFFEV